MTGRKGIAAVGLAALLFLDVVLVGWALTSNRRSAAAQTTVVAPSASAKPSSSASAKSGSPSASPTKKASGALPLTLMIEAADAATFWAGDSGGCDGKSSVSVSGDSGATWTKRDAPGSITRVKATSATEALVVGGDATCAAVLWSTADAGANWGQPQSADSAWGRYPDKPTRVLTPNGGTVAPCPNKKPVLDLAVLSASGASVLCEDGKVATTTDSGATWEESFSAPGGLGLGATGPQAGFVASGADDCEGTLVSSFEGTTVGEGTCVADATPVPGRVDVAASGTSVALVVDGTVWSSSDSGATFAKSGSLAGS